MLQTMSRLMSLVDQLHGENLQTLEKLTFGVLTAPQPCPFPPRPGCSAKVAGRGFTSSHHRGGRVHEVITFFLMDSPVNQEQRRIWAKSQRLARKLQSFCYFRLLRFLVNAGSRVIFSLLDTGPGLNVGSAVWPQESYLTALTIWFPIVLYLTTDIPGNSMNWHMKSP